MSNPDPKKLAAAILKARGSDGYDDLIARTFKGLAPAVAWKVLELADERACQTTGKTKIGYSDREVRVLGRVTGWSDLVIDEQHQDGVQLPPVFEIASTPKLAAKRTAIVADEYERTVYWGTRPGIDDPADLDAHRAERRKLLTSGDLAKLRAYRERYKSVGMLIAEKRDGALRQDGAPIWQLDEVLYEAIVDRDDPKLVKLLLEEEASFATLRFALSTAIRRDRAKVTELLISVTDDLDADSSTDTPLAEAIRLEKYAVIGALLKAGASPNVVTSAYGMPEITTFVEDGNGPMVNAVRNGAVDVLKQLLAKGGSPYLGTYATRPLFELAKDLKNKKVIALLEASKAKAPKTDMRTAIANSNIARVLELIPREGADLALERAAHAGKVDVVRAILASKEKILTDSLTHALWYSARDGHEAEVALLLARGADPTYEHYYFAKTALGVAKENKHSAIVKLLEEAAKHRAAPSRTRAPKRTATRRA